MTPRLAVLGAVIAPTARVSHLGSTVATVGLAGLPAIVTVARGGADLGVAIVLLALGAGASVAWAVDDPAEDLLASNPVSAPVRSIIRVLAAAAVAAITTGAVLGVVAIGPGLQAGWRGRLPELLAAGAVGLGVAFVAAGRGERVAGASGTMAGVLLPVVVAAMAVRWPTWFPDFEDNPSHGRWWFVVAAGALLTAWNGRDPARR